MNEEWRIKNEELRIENEEWGLQVAVHSPVKSYEHDRKRNRNKNVEFGELRKIVHEKLHDNFCQHDINK